MKILKSIFAISILSLFTLSCNKDDAPAAETKVETRKNLLVKWSEANSGLIATYTYNDGNQLTNYKLNGNASTPLENVNFDYNADGTLNELIKVSDASKLIKYTYNTDKTLKFKRYISFYGEGLEYSDNKVSVTGSMMGMGNQTVYTYNPKGNYEDLKRYSYSAIIGVGTTPNFTAMYTYDDKNNAFSSLPSAYTFPNSTNNILSEKFNNGTFKVYTYEYNADGYPTKRIENGGGVRLYEYKRL